MGKDTFIAIIFILLTIIMFNFSLFISKKYKKTLLNPIMISALLIIIILSIFKIPYSEYDKGGRIIEKVLGPIVVVLAIPLYKNRQELLRNFIPIMGGVIASIITSFSSIYTLCKLFNIDETILKSLLSKSITTPMAVESTKLLGGNEPITVAGVIVTGLMGALVAPFLIKHAKIKSNIAKGIGIGSAAHAIGTTKAVEMSEEAGAASGLSIGITGLMTTLAIIIFF